MRYKWIDAVKGFGILMVILGHTYAIPEWLHREIYSFHMPLFFIIAGYLFNLEKNTKISFFDFAKKKAKTYLVPYLFMGIINLLVSMIINCIIYGFDYINNIFRFLVGIVYCYPNISWMPNCTPIWFLMALFISSLIFWVIFKYFSRKLRIVTIILLSLVSYVFSIFNFVLLPFGLLQAFTGVGFMYCGALMKKYNVLEYMNLLSSLILLIIGCLIAYFNGETMMSVNSYGFIVLSILGALFVSISVIYLFYNYSFLCVRPIVWLGKNTMLIIGFNYLMRDLSAELYYFIPVINQYKINSVTSFFTTTILFIWLILLYNLFKKQIYRRFVR